MPVRAIPKANAAGRDTRQLILDVALDLFSEHGFAGTSMRALARLLGLRESAVYHHFESKDALFLSVTERVMDERAASVGVDLANVIDQPLDVLLSQLAKALLARLETPQERKFLRLMLTERDRFFGANGTLRSITQRPRRMMLSLINHLKEKGAVRDDVDPEVFALHFFAPLLIASNALMGGGKGPLEISLARLVREHVAFMVRAVEPTR